MQPLELYILIVLVSCCLAALIKVVAAQLRHNAQNWSAAKRNVMESETTARLKIIEGEIAKQQLAALETSFQVYFENKLLTSTTEEIIAARANFEAMYSTTHTQHLVDHFRPQIIIQ